MLIFFYRASIGELAKSGPQKVLVRDMTEDMIPRHIEYENSTKVGFNTSISLSCIGIHT